VNLRLSTVKTYAKLATQAGTLDPLALALIKTVSGFRRKEALRIDTQREVTRVGAKKVQAVSITPEQARLLKTHPNSTQGRWDTLLMCLLPDHGRRGGEVVILTVDNFDLGAGVLRFYRPKVDKLQCHRLTPDTLNAAKAYLWVDTPSWGYIWRGSRRGKKDLTDDPMSVRTLSERVRTLGKQIGIIGLSAHDFRHFWATIAVRNGTQLDRLQEAGGWAGLAMPIRYIHAEEIANIGVKLGD